MLRHCRKRPVGECVAAHLIDNAQQATPQDGSIEVTLTNSGAMQVIEIRDNGVGMDADFIRQRLFKLFDTTKGNAGMTIDVHLISHVAHLGALEELALDVCLTGSGGQRDEQILVTLDSVDVDPPAGI